MSAIIVLISDSRDKILTGSKYLNLAVETRRFQRFEKQNLKLYIRDMH